MEYPPANAVSEVALVPCARFCYKYLKQILPGICGWVPSSFRVVTTEVPAAHGSGSLSLVYTSLLCLFRVPFSRKFHQKPTAGVAKLNPFRSNGRALESLARFSSIVCNVFNSRITTALRRCQWEVATVTLSSHFV